MSTPEHLLHGHHDKMTLGKRLKEVLQMIFQRKVWQAEKDMNKKIEKAEKSQKKEEKQETQAKWTQADTKRKAQDAARRYNQSRSADITQVQASLARVERTDKVKDKIREVTASAAGGTPEATYINNIIRADANVQAGLTHLLDNSPAAAEAVHLLLTKGIELQGNTRALIHQSQILAYEAQKTGDYARILPLLTTVRTRVVDLVRDDFRVHQKTGGGRSQRYLTNVAEFLKEEQSIALTPAEELALSTYDPDGHGGNDEAATWIRWKPIIGDLVTQLRPFDAAKANAVKATGIAGGQRVPKEMVAPIDRVWSEFERLEASGVGALKTENLIAFADKLRSEQSLQFPKDVAPYSEEFYQAVQALDGVVKDKIRILAEKLKQKLREERPSVKSGIVDKEEFLTQIASEKGRLGLLFEENEQMFNLFVGTGDPSRKFRDQVFLKIHSRVLNDQRKSSRDNFGLYETADFSSYVDLIRAELAQFSDKVTGQNLGQILSDRYTNLSNAIMQCRDIDFFASQPMANSDVFNKSLGMFQNEYVKAAFNIPAVSVAYRAYETVLRSIMASNDGYIPPSLIEYDDTIGESFWDNQSEAMMKKIINAGVVPDVKKDQDNYFLQMVDKDGHTLVMDFDNPLNLDNVTDDEKKMYMTLAKGMSMALLRSIEMFGTSRVPGSDNPQAGYNNFHSMPYEGMAKSLNFFNVFIHKWRIGGYKYFHLMNMLVPDKKMKMTVDQNDSTAAIRAYMAYQDGTFEEKFGKDAKRFIDTINFSGISSAVGKDTLWRQYDTTILWDDRRREFLGGGTRLALANKYAGEKVKDMLVVGKYREEYRRQLVERNKQLPADKKHPTSGPGFTKLWKEYGYDNYSKKIDLEWDQLNGKDPRTGTRHTPLSEKTHHLVGAVETAFKSRIWVEMAMRNPLVVAHSLKIDVPLVGIPVDAKTKQPATKKITLHNMLVQEILGIPPEDTKYGESFGKTAEKGASLTAHQKKYTANILNLEGDLAVVKERAISGGKDASGRITGKVRDLTVADFDIITDPARRANALKYWEKVRQVILGTSDLDEASNLYDAFGLKTLSNDENYEWNIGKIESIEGLLEHLDKHYNTYWDDKKKKVRSGPTAITSQEGKKIPLPFLLKNAVETNFDWILSTDDMAFGRMDLLNLGSRQLIRRGGDIAAHEMGGMKVVDYLIKGLKPDFDKKDGAKMLLEVRDAYSGDMIEIGQSVAFNLAVMTDRLFAFDYNPFSGGKFLTRMGSPAQLDVWNTRRGVPGWLANERREWWDTLEHQDVIPPDSHNYYWKEDEKVNIHYARDVCHANNKDVFREIIFFGVLIAFLFTLYKSVTAKSEEESGGGGGGGEEHH